MSVFEARTRECQAEMRAADADALVLFPGPNLYYLSGFFTEPWDRHFFYLVPAEGEPCFVIPELFEEQVSEASWVDQIYPWTDAAGPDAALHAARDDLGEIDSVLLDDEMWARYVLDIEDVFQPTEMQLASRILDDLRDIKDEQELDAIRRASDIADTVSEEVRSLGDAAIGMTERELANDIERRLHDHGAEGLAFDVSSSTGPNSARVFYHHGDREIRAGEPVLLDFGCRVAHYCSDQTRMVVFGGAPSEKFTRVHEAVREAQEVGVQAVEPGISAESVEHAVHDVLAEYGYQEYTQHRTGHGVGLTPHEGPEILDGNERILEPGMVFSVEPGVYFEGEFGVRIEDLVVVTEAGCERLNETPRTWEPL